MAKSEFSKKKLLKLYDLKNMSHRDIDRAVGKDKTLGLQLHKLKNEISSRNLTETQAAKEKEKKSKADAKKAREASTSTMKVKRGLTHEAEQPKETVRGVKIRDKYKNAFGHKMTRQEVQDKYFKRTLDPLREQLAVLVDEANKRYQQQRLMYPGRSRAAMEAERTLNKAGREHFQESFEPFNANQKSRKALNREFSRVMNFLSDYTSDLQGGSTQGNYSAEGLFGGQWRKQGMAGYNEDAVSKETADLVFSIYHRLLENKGGWQRVIGYFKAVNPGIIDYGSDQLINAIYDMVMNSDEMDLLPGMDIEGTILARASEMVETMINSYQRIAVLQRSGTDYGSIEDPADAEQRRRVYEWEMKRMSYNQQAKEILKEEETDGWWK